MKRPFLFLFAILMFLSCGSDQSTSPSGKTVFKYNQPTNITSLDPAFAKSQNNIWAIDHLYNRLIELDEDLNVTPSIAKSWTISDDGLTYTFKLREDVYFHKNECFVDKEQRRVNAEDVKYSFERIISKDLNSPGSWIFAGKIRNHNPFEVVDPQTFVLHLAKPFRPMLGILSMHYCSIVPQEAVEKYASNFRSKPVGTGPFKMKVWLENQNLFLSKNEDYFESVNGQQLPYLDAVKISFIADRKTAYLELKKGALDLISGMESSFVDELLNDAGELKEEHNGKLQFIKSPFLNFEYLGINLNATEIKSPLRKKKFRQALNFSFDRVEMMKRMRNNVGLPANSGVTPKGLPSFDAQKVSGYNYDPNKARTLLAEAGYPNGKGLPTLALTTDHNYIDLATFISRQWEDIGIKCKLDILESATLRNNMRKGQLPIFRGSWIADYPDAENYFTMFYSKNPAPPNYTQFTSDTFDTLYEAALIENNDEKRFQLYQEMDKLLVDEAPVVFLFYDQTALCTQANIQGLTKNALNLLVLKYVKKL